MVQAMKQTYFSFIGFLAGCILYLTLDPSLAYTQISSDKIKDKVDLSEDNSTHKHPLIWQVQCPQLPIFHFVGTMHIPDQRFAQLSPTLLRVLDQADAVYGELDLSDKMGLTAKLTPHLFLPTGVSLEAKLPKELYATLTSYLELKGSSISLFSMMKPEALEIMLPMIDLIPLLAQGLPSFDEILLQYASKQGKTVGGIETIEEQIKSLFSKSEAESIESLQHTIQRLIELHQKGESPHTLLMKAFFSGDENAIQQEINAELKEAPPSQLALFDRLLRQRNLRMAERIITLVKENKRSYIFAFGTAHFIGKDSINSLLESQLRCISKRVH